jgi:hypothetical protein
MCIKSLYAKAPWGRLYQVELNYLVNGRFVLRPIDHKPYQFLEVTAEQLKCRFRLFPVVGF